MLQFRKFLLSIILLASVTICNAQVKFYASVDSEEVLENGYVKLSFTIENAKGSQFTAPSFTGFQRISGPGTSTSVNITNGRRASKETYTYTLKSVKKGKVTIGKASVIIGGKKYYTKPLKINVVKADTKNVDFFVKMELSDSTAYPGQQIIVKYVLHYALTKKVSSIDIRNEDEFEGFFATRINDRQESPVQKTIDGRQWVIQTVRKIALFPQTLGDFNFKAADFVIRVPDPSRGSVFFSGFREEFTSTNAATLLVNALQTSDPYFCGAVGKYDCSAHLSKTTINTDQSFALTLKIVGDGDPKLVRPPVLRLSDSLEVYDPNILQEQQMVQNGKQQHYTTYEYLIVPKYAGNYTIVPSMTYYDVDSNAIIEKKTVPYQLRVVQGNTSSSSESATLTQRSDKMVPYLEEVSVSQNNSSFFGSLIFWLMTGLLLMGFPSLAWLKYRDMQIAKIDPNQTKFDEAHKVAEERLRTAKSFMSEGNQRSFYDEVSKTIYGYVSDKLQLQTSELSSNNITQKLRHLAVEETAVSQIADILKSCEMSLFAGTNESGQMQKIYELSLESIAQIEKKVSSSQSN